MNKMIFPILWAFLLLEVSSVSAVTSKMSFEMKESVNQPINKNGEKNWLSFEVKSKKHTIRNYKYFEGSARYYYSSSDAMYSVPEVYFKRENSSNVLVVGRKILDWNKYEKFWGFNHINAQRSYDLLDNKQEGLVGLFYEQEFLDNFKASFVLSYLYIPQMNPPIKVKDGKITSPGDYVKYPEELNYLGRMRPIVYEINKPSPEDIVFQKSLGFNLAYEKKNLLLSTYALYKPENHLRINLRDSLNRLDYRDQDTAEVTASPFVNYHGVFGMLAGFKYSVVRHYLGLEVVDANTELDNIFKTIDPLKVEPEARPVKNDDFDIRPSYILQTYMHYSAVVPRDFFSVSFNHIRLLSKESVQKDSFFQDASRFINAMGLGGSLDFTDNLSMAVKWYYDLARKDNIVKTEAGWSNKSFGILLGAEILKAPDEKSYWSKYRTNDSVYSKFSIVF